MKLLVSRSAWVLVVCTMLVLGWFSLGVLLHPSGAEVRKEVSVSPPLTYVVNGELVEVDIRIVKFNDVRKVVLWFEDDTHAEYILHKSQVDQFVVASKKLHHDPGVNPYNNRRTTKLTRINIGRPILMGPFWWTTGPSLGKHSDIRDGVILYEFNFHTAWESPDQ